MGEGGLVRGNEIGAKKISAWKWAKYHEGDQWNHGWSGEGGDPFTHARAGAVYFEG